MERQERLFEKELGELKRRLLYMAAIAEEMIDNTVKALVTREERFLEPLKQAEDELNSLQIEIDEEVLRLLATRAPVAADLRFVIAATKINSEIERIGDLTVNIAHQARILAAQPPLKPLVDLPRMAELARRMVRESLDSFVRGDDLLAQSVIMADDRIDELKDQIFRELLTYMISDPRNIERALALILISRHLERIGDHATNIAEDTIYMILGRDVRHPKKTARTEDDG